MGLTTQTYDIITRIAIGNGAIVYRALEKDTMRQVALKLLTQDGDVDHRLDLDALFIDAPWLRSIDGTHVCRLLSAYSDDDGHVLAYEFAPGNTGVGIPHNKPLDATQALDVAAQLISALRSGERQRCPHGDLKPSNIVFVDVPSGRPYAFVLDWGLAAYRHAHPDDSFSYLAPEMLAGDPPSHRADLFSAGAVLFYLYTGKLLVAGTDREQLIEAWRSVRPAMLAGLRPDLSPKLVEWVCSLLAFDPAQRPASAVEAGAALTLLEPPPPMVPPESIRPRPVPKPVAAPPASVIHKPSSVASPVASGIRVASVMTDAEAMAVPVPRITPSVKKPNLLPKILIGIVLVVVLGLGIWWGVTTLSDTSSKEATPVPPHTTARPPSPSVKAPNISAPPKPITLPEPVRAVVAPAPAPEDKGGPFIASDAFAYPEGKPIKGFAGGKGWAQPWQGLSGKIESGSLSYLNHPATGGTLAIPESPQDMTVMRSLGPLTRFIADPARGGHWYMGLLVQHNSGTVAAGGEVMFNPFDMVDVHNLLRIVVEDKGGAIRVNFNAESQAVEVPQDGKPLYLILRIDLKNPALGNFDIKATLWINPDLAAAKPDKTGQKLELELKNQHIPTQLGLLIRKKRGQAVTRIDEVRFAHRMADLIFKPKAKDDDIGP